MGDHTFCVSQQNEVMHMQVLGGEKRKVTVFNLDREDERGMYEWLHGRNFSQLVKRLIRSEIQRGSRTTVVLNTTQRSEEDAKAQK